MSDENGDDNSAEKPVVIAIGTSFPSFDVLSTAIKNWELQNCVQLYVRDSRSVEAARKRATKKTYKQELGFSEIRYACIHGGRKYRSQSLGKRSVKGTFLKECPFYIKLKASSDGESLVVNAMCGDHNHEMNRESFSLKPRLQRTHPRKRKKEVETLPENMTEGEKYREALAVSKMAADYLSHMGMEDFRFNLTVLHQLNDVFSRGKRILVAEIEEDTHDVSNTVSNEEVV